MLFDTSIRKNLWWGEKETQACLADLSCLQLKYPDSSFGCNPPPGAYPYDALEVSSGLTRTQTHQIVMNAIESAVYGRWKVKIR